MEEVPIYLFSEQDDFSTSVEKKARSLLIFIFINMVITVLLLSREIQLTSGENLMLLSVHFLNPLPPSSQSILKGEELKQCLLKNLTRRSHFKAQNPKTKDQYKQRTACEQ